MVRSVDKQPPEKPPDDRDTSRDALVFAMPFLQAVGLSRLEKATALALMCWNMAMLPDDRRAAARAELDELFSFAASWFPESRDGIAELGAWMDKLIRRKQEKFGHRLRVIVTHKVSTDAMNVTLTTGTVGMDRKTWRLN